MFHANTIHSLLLSLSLLDFSFDRIHLFDSGLCAIGTRRERERDRGRREKTSEKSACISPFFCSSPFPRFASIEWIEKDLFRIVPLIATIRRRSISRRTSILNMSRFKSYIKPTLIRQTSQQPSGNPTFSSQSTELSVPRHITQVK